MSLIIQAARFAERAHRGQLRKYTERPYIEHPMRVAGMVSLCPFSVEEDVAAAWLHDVIEDCGVTDEQILSDFGREVTGLVRCLTNPSHGSALPRAERKRIDREFLATCSPIVRFIKLTDRFDNLCEMSGAEPKFRALYANESIDLARALDVGYSPIIESLAADVIAAAKQLREVPVA